jgi:hypothetical protein
MIIFRARHETARFLASLSPLAKGAEEPPDIFWANAGK